MVLVFFAGAMLIGQALLLTFLTIQVITRLNSLTRQLRLLSDLSHPGLKFLHWALDRMEKTLQKIPTLNVTISQNLTTLVDSAKQADQYTAQRINSLSLRAETASEHLDDIIDKVSQETFKLHRTLLNPAFRLSGLVRAGLITLKLLLSHSDSHSKDTPPDQQIFI